MQFVGAFAELRKGIIGFVMCVRLFVCNNWAVDGRGLVLLNI